MAVLAHPHTVHVRAMHPASTVHTQSTVGIRARTAPVGGRLNVATGQGPQGNATDFFSPTGTPIPHEAVRERFSATYTGIYTLGRGRFDSQSRSFAFQGAGESTYSLHGDAQLGLVTPKDPTRPLSGLLTQFDRNNNTNYVYGIDVAGDQVTGVDRFGRPTHLTYTTDVNVSSGIAVESLSSGTIDIRYVSSRAPARGIFTSGTAVMVIRGSIYSLGSSQNLKNTHINP
jgi:hypothetical protein